MILEPRSEVDVRDAVLDARARRQPVVVTGGGTKLSLGRPVQAAQTLSLRNLSGITLYEPAEMVIGAWAGTPLSEVQKALDAKGQMLAFEPPDFRALLGSKGEPTMGGLVATGFAGPRRIVSGGLRDSLIGVRFVNGRGEIVKNGGRVMKNVTGLDLVKPQAGAFGTLGVLTEVIFKVVPKPPAVATLVLEGLDNATAIRAMAAALMSPFEVTGAAHEPGDLPAGSAMTCLRIEGFPEQIAYRTGELRKVLAAFGELKPMDQKRQAKLWPRISNGGPLAERGIPFVWRASVPPAKGAALASEIGGPACFDWGGGLVWLGASDADERLAAKVQAAAARHGGYATLLKAPEAFRASGPVFQPLDPAVQKLQVGVKASFDPDGVINPGRMYAGV